ncbi:MAG: putative acyl-CoA dehydrogenase [Acidimicrobiales bacterium]|nr:putative acyl-CoA dehydrogenase [Acidimicrobiales bacterium]
MDLHATPEDETFRREVADWLQTVLPALPPQPAADDWSGRRAFDLAWQRQLFEAGLGGVSWPKEFGGLDASPTQHLVFLEELERVRAPGVGVLFVALLHAGPTLIAEGTEAQRARHVPAILRGEEVWCQGFSEPDAGSDLASLRTRAVRDGDSYVISGQKVWTSNAQVADYCELLVCTDPAAPRHRGLSWLIMPMDAPGVTVRPLRTMTGSEEFSELFLDEVRVPASNRVGGEGDGWRVAMVTFGFERGTGFVRELLESQELMHDLRATAQAAGLLADAGVRRSFGRLVGTYDALWALTQRNVSSAARSGVPGLGGSIFKLAYSQFRDDLGELSMLVQPPSRRTMADPQLLGHCHAISTAIAAGTSQVQRNIIGERLLGLPKER